MPLISQQGELAERLRRFFNLTGRIPSQVDETVVPIASVVDLDVPPYRRDPVWTGLHQTRAQLAANFTFVGVCLPDAMPGALLVERHSVNGGAAMQAVLKIASRASLVANATNFVASSVNPNLEVPHPNLSTGVLVDTGAEFIQGDDTTQLGAAELLRLGVGVSTGPSLPFYWPVLIFPGEALVWWGDVVATALGASLHCRYYASDTERRRSG